MRLAQRTHCSVAVPNYRLTPQKNSESDPEALSLRHPVHASDILLALDFLISGSASGSPAESKLESPPELGAESESEATIHTNASTFAYDSRRIFLIGHSCGAHIISSIVLSSPEPSLTPSSHILGSIRGVVLSEGIYDLDLLLTSFPSYRNWFVAAAFGDKDSFDEYSVTKFPLRSGTERIHWLIIHSPNDTLVDVKQSEAFYNHLVSLTAASHGHSLHGDTMQKDWTTIAEEHNDMLKTRQYSDFVGGFINSLHFH